MGLGNLSGGEIVILAVICLLVFGAHRLPEVGQAIGKGFREFRRAMNEVRDQVEPPPPHTPPPAATPPRRLLD